MEISRLKRYKSEAATKEREELEKQSIEWRSILQKLEELSSNV